MDVTGVRTLHGILTYHAQQTPDKVFVFFEGANQQRRYTFGELDECTNRVASSLRDIGLAKGDRINIHLGNCPEFLIAWLAAAKLGISVVPTNPASSPNEWQYIVEHSAAKATVVELGQIEHARRLCQEVSTLQLAISSRAHAELLSLEALVAAGDPRDLREQVAAGDECAINYTSGTTSHPKGVVLSHANYVYAGEAQGRHICLRPADRYLVVLPLFHASGQTHSTIPALVFGASIALMHRFSASRYFDQALAYEATVGSLFAAPIRMILTNPSRPEHRRSQMRLALYAQNITNAQLDEWDLRYGVPLIQIWGMTETMSLPIMEPVFGPRKRMSMGTAIYGYEARVLDAQGNDVPPDTVGELVVKGTPGRTIMKEYLSNPSATAETIRGDWLYSGDDVRVDGEGYFFFVDRAKDVIKCSGENIAAAEVEAVIREHHNVEDAAVIGVPDAIRDEIVKAFIIRKPRASLDEAEIVAWCGTRLSQFKVPAIVEFREHFPRTAVGKIQKHLLR